MRSRKFGYSAVWEQWPYPTGPFDGAAPFVSVASGHYESLWQFNKDSADTFQITTMAWVNRGEVYSYWHDYTDGFYYALKDSG